MRPCCWRPCSRPPNTQRRPKARPCPLSSPPPNGKQANQLNNAPAFAQQAYIKASNAESDDRFGDVIALSGDTLVVGAPYEDSAATGINGSQTNGATDSGAVYVFVRSGSTWTQQAYIKANNSEAGDQFGTSVAIFGETLIVGAPYEDSAPGDIIPSNSLTNAGAAYVFVREAGVWSQQAMLKAANAEANDILGFRHHRPKPRPCGSQWRR
ncbi:MAG: FG-GAP repeat protein [Chloroflexi bacterium]|nr:FG-GAP repeat protein [Chloroflexota bacterium]